MAATKHQEKHGKTKPNDRNKLVRATPHVADSCLKLLSNMVHGPFDQLQEEVAEKFRVLASGKPPNISTAQLVQHLGSQVF